jgi:hypothetical protein
MISERPSIGHYPCASTGIRSDGGWSPTCDINELPTLPYQFESDAEGFMSGSISYREIDTYSNDDGNLGTNWFGPQSSVAFWAPGTSTYWSDQFAVSSFNLGASLGTGSTDVLNTSSGFGSDSLDLTSLLATTSSYSATDATVFNWSGNPATPGFGCDTFSLTVAGGDLIYIDTLTSSYWGEVRDYEASINTTTNAATITVDNFQDTNLQVVGGGSMVGAFNVQSGTFDFSKQTSDSFLDLRTASDATRGSTQTYAVLAGTSGDTFEVQNGTQTTDYAGTALNDTGSTSLVDFYDNGGGNTIDLTASQISSNLFLAPVGLGALNNADGQILNGSFDPEASAASFATFTTVTAHGNLVSLNPTGTGVANIVTSDASSFSTVTGFELGRDMLDMALTSSGGTGYAAYGFTIGGTAAVAIVDTYSNTSSTLDGDSGVVLSGISALTVASHITTVMFSGVEHLYVH